MSGLLGGDLREVFGSVFAPLLLDAEITKVALLPDGAGGMTETTETAACKGMVEKYSAYERAQAGIPATDVKLIVLQKGVALVPDLDSRISIRGQLYSIQGIDEDPAQAAWTLQGRPVHAPAGPVLVWVNAPARSAAGTGAPQLSFYSSAPALALAGVGGQASVTVPVSAAASAAADVGAGLTVSEPGQTVVAEAPASAVAGAGGAPAIGVAAGAPAQAEADAGAPVRLTVPVAAPASAVAAALAPAEVAGAVHVEAAAEAQGLAGGVPAIAYGASAQARAEASVGAALSVTLQAHAASAAEAGAGAAPHVTVPVSARAEAIAASAGTPAITVPARAAAAALADAAAGPAVTVPITAPALAVAAAGGEPDIEAGGGPARSTPVFRSVGRTEGSFDCPAPSGIQEGDLLIGVFYDFAGGQTLVPPAGWTTLGSAGDPVPDATMAYKIAGPSEPASYTYSLLGNGPDYPFGAIFRYDNVDASDPITDFALTDGLGSTRTIPGVTAENDNSMLFAFSLSYVGGGELTSDPAGMTSRLKEYDIMGFYDEPVDAGATGNRTHTHSSASVYWTTGSVIFNGAPP